MSKKLKVTVYVNEDQAEWLQDEVRKGTFKSISEGIRESVTIMRNISERLDREEMKKWVKEQHTQ